MSKPLSKRQAIVAVTPIIPVPGASLFSDGQARLRLNHNVPLSDRQSFSVAADHSFAVAHFARVSSDRSSPDLASVAMTPSGSLPVTESFRAEADPQADESQARIVGPATISHSPANHPLAPIVPMPGNESVSAESGQNGNITHPPLAGPAPFPSDGEVVSAIRGLHRKRIDFHREEKSITLRCRAICRRLVGGDLTEADRLYDQVDAGEGDHAELGTATAYLQPFLRMRDIAKSERMIPEKAMRKLAEKLPAWTWMQSVKGFGAFGLAQIIGECGDLNNYANPGKLWKRMGLAVFDGKAQRKTTDKEKAIVMGYSPSRRSIMFVIGDSLLKKQNAYRDLYLARKSTEQQKVPDGTKMLWHRRAQRYMEKRLLRDLWSAWRAATKKEAA